jgi:hypothetical protein
MYALPFLAPPLTGRTGRKERQVFRRPLCVSSMSRAVAQNTQANSIGADWLNTVYVRFIVSLRRDGNRGSHTKEARPWGCGKRGTGPLSAHARDGDRSRTPNALSKRGLETSPLLKDDPSSPPRYWQGYG